MINRNNIDIFDMPFVDEYDEEEYKKCENCSSKIQDEIFCNKCKKEIQERFKNIIKENFEIEEIKYIDELIDGIYIKDYVGLED